MEDDFVDFKEFSYMMMISQSLVAKIQFGGF
jgi:hypothetical protein